MIQSKRKVLVKPLEGISEIIVAELTSVDIFPKEGTLTTDVQVRTTTGQELTTDVAQWQPEEVNQLIAAMGGKLEISSFEDFTRFLEIGTQERVKALGFYGLAPEDWEVVEVEEPEDKEEIV